MTDYAISGLSVKAAPAAATDYLPLLDTTDFITPPAGAAGSDKRSTIAAIQAAGLSATQTATVYVTTAGSDGNNGLSWNTACATVNHAISLLGANGGTVEIGYGTFSSNAAISAGGSGIRLRGRGVPGTTLAQTSTSANGITITSSGNLQDIAIEGMTITGPGSGTGIGIYVQPGGGGSITRLSISNVLVSLFGSYGINVNNAILGLMRQVQCSLNGGTGFYLNSGTTWHITDCWAVSQSTARGWHLNGIGSSVLLSCGSDNNALGYEVAGGSLGVLLQNCDASATVAAGGLDGSSFKFNGVAAGCAARNCYVVTSNAIAYYVTGSSINVTLQDCIEGSPGGSATASFQVDFPSTLNLINATFITAPALNSTFVALSPTFTFMQNLQSGGTPAAFTTGTNSSGSAPAITPAFTSGTAAQLSDTTRDYEVYLQFGAAGTAMSVAIGPTNTPANTLINSAVVTAGEVVRFRVPAGWYTKVTFTTTTLAHQIAIGC